MPYTWEEVMLGIDVKNEALKEEQQAEDIETKQKKEDNAMSAWSLGLSILGAAVFGPKGYTIGKQIGKWGADWYYDWEDEEVEEGKFDKEISRKYNKVLKETAKSKDVAQAIGTVTDLASMYVMAGGLEEGPTDFGTFGSGEDAWTVFSDEAEIPLLGWDLPGKQLPKGQSLFTGGASSVSTLADVGNILTKGKNKSVGKGKGSTVSSVGSNLDQWYREPL